MNMDQISFIQAEVMLLAVSILSLLYGLFFRERDSHVKIILLFGIAFSMYSIIVSDSDKVMLFQNSLLHDQITQIFRFILLAVTALCFIFTFKSSCQFEVPILMIISTFGLMLMIASNDLITMYLSMELSTLTMYICVASYKSEYSSTEAGLKYFILGTVASCIFLFGASIVSGFTASFSFLDIGQYTIQTSDGDFLPILFIFGTTMILIAFLFKMSVVPFHAWIADVYSGAPWYVSLFIGSVSKIAIFGLLVRSLFSIFDSLNIQMQTMLVILSVLSMFIGSIAAIMQNDIRRIFAYSAVSNIGFALAGLAVGTYNGIASGFIYVLLYTILMFIPGFVIIGLLTKQQSKLLLSDLRELSTVHPYKTGFLAIIMFSMAGLPPFASFFGKFHILMNIIAQGMSVFSLLFVIAAILSTVYCIRILQNIYFTELKTNIGYVGFSAKFEMTIILLIIVINLLYSFYSSQAVSFFANVFSA